MAMLLKYLPKPGRRIPPIDVLRSVWPTAATPATFAPPVDIDEDDASMTFYFHIGERAAATVDVTFAGQVLFIHGESLNLPNIPRAIRSFMLHSSVDVLGVSTRLEQQMLIIRIPKNAAGRRTIVVRREGE
jgi:HSP20 family molecular chaperone IbpA